MTPGCQLRTNASAVLPFVDAAAEIAGSSPQVLSAAREKTLEIFGTGVIYLKRRDLLLAEELYLRRTRQQSRLRATLDQLRYGGLSFFPVAERPLIHIHA